MTGRAVLLSVVVAAWALPALAQPMDETELATTQPAAESDKLGDNLGEILRDTSESLGPSHAVRAVLMVTVLAVAPAIAVMVTSFTRVIVVLGLLRQAIGTGQLPPNQVLFGLALLVTVVVMAPVFEDVRADALSPLADGRIDSAEAWRTGVGHVRGFMIRQIDRYDNAGDVYVFLRDELAERDDLQWRDVPLSALVPAFAISELKMAFVMGLQIFLPFIIVDLLVASTLTSMGMVMLPPVLVSLPFKLLLFVLADGWGLVVGSLVQSFR